MNPSWLDLAPVPTGVIRHQRFVYVNQALADLIGLPREALVGRHYTEHIAPEDRERVAERQDLRLRGEQVPGVYQLRALRADGSRRLVEIWASAVEGDIIFQLADRTDRAQRQEKLAALARLGVAVAAMQTEEAVYATLARVIPQIGMSMVRLAPAGEDGEHVRIAAMSAPGDLVERFLAASGLDPASFAGTWGPGTRLAWRDGSAYLDDMPRAATRFLGGDPAAQAGVEVTREAMLARGVVLRIDVAGEPAELVILMADWLLPEDLPACRLFGAQVSAALDVQRLLADLRRSYADLARAQEQLVQRERLAAIGELAAVVAHEVRNPLGVLVNSLGAFRKLLGEDVEGAARTLVEIMDEETARLNHIVHDLLDFARPSMPALHREPVAPVIEEAVAAVLGGRDDITLVREIEELPPVPVDARLVRQAVLNITANAVQAMPEGGMLTVRLRRDDLDAPAIRLEIEDTGTGIPEDVQPRIFEPFFTTRATGTGIGLAVVRRVVDTHRGRIRVDTAEGRGTKFTVWLPMGDAAG